MPIELGVGPARESLQGNARKPGRVLDDRRSLANILRFLSSATFTSTFLELCITA
jgi:hypothetical protein